MLNYLPSDMLFDTTEYEEMLSSSFMMDDEEGRLYD